MQDEYHSILTIQTWTLEDLFHGKCAITFHWVYKKKPNVIGDGVIYKAWLVTHGFEQCFGLDYTKKFVPIVKWETICIIVTIATHNGWCIEHLEVQITFLNGFVNEEGFIVPRQEQKLCHLWCALYGLCQSPRAWYIHIHQYLHHTGLHKTDANATSTFLLLLLLYSCWFFMLMIYSSLVAIMPWSKPSFLL